MTTTENIPKQNIVQALPVKETDLQREVLRRVLKRTRKIVGMKQSDVASALGVTQSFISKYESGQRVLDLIDLRAVSIVLKTNIANILALFEAEIAKDHDDEAE